MVRRREPWPPGTPCWVDIMVTDLAASQAFYSAVLGWSYTDSQAQFGGYCNALLDGEQVAGMSPTMPGMEQAPHAWSTYLATDDIQATNAAVLEAGGRLVIAPMPIGGFGSMAIWTDPTGAVFGAWQPGTHTGFQVAEESGSVAWIDLMTPDPAAAETFYAQVFGLTYTDGGIEGMHYVLFTPAGAAQPAGGLGSDPSGETPACWSVCFAVDDVEAAAGRIRQAGGAVTVEPYDFPYGRLLHATGPDGEAFSLISGPVQ